MDAINLELEKRDVLGKAVKRVREAGFVPAVIHDHGKPSLNVQAEYQAIFHAYKHAGKHHPLSLKAGDRKFTALIKSVTLDPKKNSLTHVVFNAVKQNEKVTAEVPVHIRLDEGNDATPAERNSLLILHNLTSVDVEATPSHLPDALEFDGEKLVEVGDHATVADLIVPEGVEVKTDPSHVLASVNEPSAVAAANDAAAGAEEETAPAESEEAVEGESTEAEAGEKANGEAKEAEK
jgi:large subunit ribosomal protein L25